MIISQLDLFCSALAVNATAGTALRGDVIDIGPVSRDIGAGQPTYFIVVVTTAFTGGAATVNIQLASDAAAAIATNGSASVHYQTGAIPIANLIAGKAYVVALPQGVTYERYLGVLVTTATATTTAGSISAFLSPDPTGWKAYPDALS
jgi:hypothetical protein